MNPEDHQRVRVDPHVEVEPTANVCPSGASRTRSISAETAGSSWAGSRSEPAWQGRRRGGSLESGSDDAGEVLMNR